MAHLDVMVLGGGTMGLAAAWELAKRGKRALVLEQFALIHDRGAHAGHTRIFRHAYAEGADYIPLLLRADHLGQDLEAQTRTTVLHRVGGLEMAAPGYGHARRARESATQHHLDFQWLTPVDVRRTWPMLHLPDDWEAGFGAGAGFLDVEPALRALLQCAQHGGVALLAQTPATAWGASAHGVWVSAGGQRYEAEALLVTAGAWAGRTLQDVGVVHGGGTVVVPEQWRHGANGGATLQQGDGAGMTQGVGAEGLRQPGAAMPLSRILLRQRRDPGQGGAGAQGSAWRDRQGRGPGRPGPNG